MAAGVHEECCDAMVNIPDRLVAEIGVHCRKAQREVGNLKLGNIPDDVEQVFALTDNLLAFIGKCLMAGTTRKSSHSTVPLHVKLSLFERLRSQAQSMELHEQNVSFAGIPFHFASTAAEFNRNCMSRDQYNVQKKVHGIAANARHVWDGDWKRSKRGRKLRLDKLVSTEMSEVVGSDEQVDQNSESAGRDSSVEVLGRNPAAVILDRCATESDANTNSSTADASVKHGKDYDVESCDASEVEPGSKAPDAAVSYRYDNANVKGEAACKDHDISIEKELQHKVQEHESKYPGGKLPTELRSLEAYAMFKSGVPGFACRPEKR